MEMKVTFQYWNDIQITMRNNIILFMQTRLIILLAVFFHTKKQDHF